jgi:pyruvate dehydrogenase E2 component (dihydrolipoamide acetyltransferase)
MAAFVMPSLGSDMEAGKLVEWLKKPGDEVRRGDVVAVVETQKGAIEIESFQEGMLTGYLTDLGKTVPVGTPLATIKGPDEPDEDVAPEPARGEETRSEPEATRIAPAPVSVPPPPVARPSAAKGARIRISPAARRLAAASSIDPADLAGTGPEESIVLADVLARIESGPAAKAPPTAEPAGDKPTGMRAAIAASMARSKREIPHYYLTDTIDLTAAEDFIAGVNADRPPESRLLLGALFVKAVALAAKKHKEFNGHFENEAYSAAQAVHAGMAINIRGGGLVAPALHHAETLDLDTLMTKMRDLIARVRVGRFRGSELSDPTITVSSLGERGVEGLYGVIYPPQVAIVGFGTPALRPWEAGGEISLRRIVTMTLAADHRVSDGHSGARFMNTIAKHLQKPEGL